MKRKLKFRAWDGQQIHRVEQWSSNSWIAVPLQVSQNDWELIQISTTDVELMQFTGLTDKNGVEIYEGDVVKGVVKYPQLCTWDNDDNCNFPMGGEVYYDHVGFSLKAIQSMCDPERDGMVYYFSFGGDCGETFDEMEVIGNIYENLDLISPPSL